MTWYVRLGDTDRKGHIQRGNRGKSLCGFPKKDLWLWLSDHESPSDLLDNWPDKGKSALCSVCRSKMVEQMTDDSQKGG